jgi:hypothetical protein
VPWSPGLDRRWGTRGGRGLYLLATVAAGGLYRRRRTDLDGDGAEAIGELHARIANFAATNPTDSTRNLTAR